MQLSNTLLKNKRVNLPEDTILKLRTSFYVDNCVTSVDTQEELQEFIKEATEIFADAQLDLRLWEFTILDPTYEEKHLSSVLGMIWNRDNDTTPLSRTFETS